ncbi:FHA domain-containing protein [bacterium]|nr:FHA domain-containing protein [bacterium]
MIVFYNKPLLRILALLAGITLAYVGYAYAVGMGEVLGRQGTLDALAVFGYVAASYLVLLVAEVADSHYVRAFGGISLMAGLATAWHFLSLDLMKMPMGRGGSIATVFWLGAVIGLIYLLIIVIRLVLDKMNLGRPVMGEMSRISQYEGDVEPPPYRERDAEPAIDKSVWDDPSMMPETISSDGDQAQAAAGIEPEPVSRIVGIGGAHSGEVFELAPGEYIIGRSESCDIKLTGDNQSSRSHAKISVDEDGLAEIEDLGSTNGTLIAGSRITTAKLTPGMSFVIGTTTFKVE